MTKIFEFLQKNKNKDSKKPIIDLENCIALDIIVDQNNHQLFI